MRSLKSFVAVASVIGSLVGTAYGQGFFLNNYNSENYGAVYSPSVTSNGLIFTTTVANQFGTLDPGYPGQALGSQLEYVDFNAVLLGGPTAASADQLMAAWLLTDYGGSVSSYASTYGYTADANPPYPDVVNASGINVDAGLIWDPNSTELKIPGVGTSPGYIDLYLWEGNYTSFAQAGAAGAAVGTTGVIVQPVVFGINPEVPDLSMPDVLLQPSLVGDANLDGKVDINDLTIVLTHYGQTAGATWTTGDFLGDGKVDINDLTVVLAHYGQTAGAAGGAVAAAPEPCSLALLAAGFAAVLGCAWRRRSSTRTATE